MARLGGGAVVEGLTSLAVCYGTSYRTSDVDRVM